MQSKKQGPSSGLQCHAWSDLCHLSDLLSTHCHPCAALLLLGHAKHWFKVSHLMDSVTLWLKTWTLDSHCQGSNTACVSLPVRQTVLCLTFFTYKILLCVLFLWSPEKLIHVYQHSPLHALSFQYYTCNFTFFMVPSYSDLTIPLFCQILATFCGSE